MTKTKTNTQTYGCSLLIEVSHSLSAHHSSERWMIRNIQPYQCQCGTMSMTLSLSTLTFTFFSPTLTLTLTLSLPTLFLHTLTIPPTGRARSRLLSQSWREPAITGKISSHKYRYLNLRQKLLLVSSVRSSYSHPDLLVIHPPTTPLFQTTPVLNTGLSLSEPIQLYQRQSLDSSAGYLWVQQDITARECKIVQESAL